MFRGSLTAIATPFRAGEVDKAAFDALLEWQIEAGSHGIVACGTTGESPVLTKEEHIYIVERSVAVVKGRIPVIAGTGSNSTAKTIELTREAQNAGADAALVVTPYYNRPTQDGLYAHYRAVAEAVSLPIIVYNVPSRCAVDLKTETMARLAKIPNIVGIKDASCDLTRPAQLARLAGSDFCQLSGEDITAIEFLEQGGHGCISVTSNVAPTLCAEMHRHWQKGEKDAARAIQQRLMPLHKSLFVETSPAPVKYALSTLGLCTDEVRLPLVAATPAARKAVDDAMAAAGIANHSEAAEPKKVSCFC
jgi:4-hydroxy-tetrahydrodipicolinate synthase